MNPEHLEIVRQGAAAIAAWCRNHDVPRLELDEANLIGANLIGADLPEADLHRANLRRANLGGANLTLARLGGANLPEADLRRANLRRANLVGANMGLARLGGADLGGADLGRANLGRANLVGANLGGANLGRALLSYANLTGADLTGADLTGANLSGADLHFTTFHHTPLGEAQFSGARFQFTVIAHCDLSVALGLDSVIHDGPSSIGLDTIVRSGGTIPEAFLRGAGVPDPIITYLWSLAQEPIQFYTCFISYTSRDQAFAQRLYHDLQGKGVHCWYYPETALMGHQEWEDVDRAIRVYDKLVVICSRASLTSPAVLWEIEHALATEDAIARENAQKSRDAGTGEQPRLTDKDVLFPIRVDNYVSEGWEHPRKLDVTGHTIGDFVGWDTDHQRYLRSLDRLLHALDPKSWPAVE